LLGPSISTQTHACGWADALYVQDLLIRSFLFFFCFFCLGGGGGGGVLPGNLKTIKAANKERQRNDKLVHPEVSVTSIMTVGGVVVAY